MTKITAYGKVITCNFNLQAINEAKDAVVKAKALLSSLVDCKDRAMLITDLESNKLNKSQ